VALSDLVQGSSNKSDTVITRYNKNVTRLMTQGCNNIVNIVSDLLELHLARL
jgi:hypothetical protein